MPKFDAKAEAEISLTLTSQAEIKKQTSALLVDGKGLALRELVSPLLDRSEFHMKCSRTGNIIL